MYFFPTTQIFQEKERVRRNESEKSSVVGWIKPGTNHSKFLRNKPVFWVMLFLGNFLTHLAWRCVSETTC